ncbi:hypothetical protein [Amycolatopsis sp. GM8]|uniref:hypothetical protein n=1 Tax=Amycolatopsis sp. GM8 TaxID=2896530 RepID=UPI0035ABD3EA
MRMPRTERAPALLRTEQKWLPVLAERLPLPSRRPCGRARRPGCIPPTWSCGRGRSPE